jgi:hypothetical protein
MVFLHKLWPGFDLRWIPRPGRRARRALGPSSRFRACAARYSVALLAFLPAGVARAEAPEVAQIAPAAVNGGAPVAVSAPTAADSSSQATASGPYSGPTRARRRTPRAAAEIRSEPRGGASPARAGFPSPPRDLADVNGWLDYKARAHVLALPLESRLFYRRGVLAHDGGKRDDGERWVRAAAELDPSFMDPHLTIAAWSLPGRPSQALVHWAAALDLVRESFALQVGIAANLLFLAFQSLLIALLIAGLIILVLRVPELSHPWRERLTAILRPATARWWAISFAILPFLAGLGIVLPAIIFLGLLWPVLRARERTLFVLLTVGFAGVPWTASVLHRLTTPLDAERAPLYGVALLENEPWSGARQRRLSALSTREPENPFLHFALAWTARRGGDLATAEREYRRALERWAGNDRVLTNLGNVLAMRGRQDEALELYKRAITARPSNPAPHFNESQIYTQRFEYVAATEALSRASALDFDLVRDYQALGTNDGVLALVDQWIAPHNFWLALGDAPASATAQASLPPPWRGHMETSGWRFSLIVVVCGVFGTLLGLWGHRSLPLRACGNCGRVVCRRCAQRRREVALCHGCAGLETRAQNPDFARVLLKRSQRQTEKFRDVTRTVLAILVPGFGLIAYRRAVTPLLLIATGVLLVGPFAGVALPFELEPRVGLSDRLPPMTVRIALGALIYAISIAGYFSCAAKARLQAAALIAPISKPAAQGQRRSPAQAA